MGRVEREGDVVLIVGFPGGLGELNSHTTRGFGSEKK